MQDSRCSLSTDKHRGTITALVPLTRILVIQPRMPLTFLATWALTGSSSATVKQHLQALFFWTAFQALCPQPVVLPAVMTNVQDLTRHIIAPQAIGLSPLIHPIPVPLQSLPQQINTPVKPGVTYKLTKGAFERLIHIADKDMKQGWSQH